MIPVGTMRSSQPPHDASITTRSQPQGAEITGTTRRSHQAEEEFAGVAVAQSGDRLPLPGGSSRCRLPLCGPGTVTRDRPHYTTAMTNSWKEQLLLNIVKSRYGDAPAFLEVVSVVSGYSLETGVSLGGQFSPENLRGDTFVSGGLSGKFTDRPTISYAPMTGENFVRSLMAPVPLEALMSGHPGRRACRLGTHARRDTVIPQ